MQLIGVSRKSTWSLKVFPDLLTATLVGQLLISPLPGSGFQWLTSLLPPGLPVPSQDALTLLLLWKVGVNHSDSLYAVPKDP